MDDRGCGVCFAGNGPGLRGVEVHWLDRMGEAVTQGVSWGVPWQQGKIQKDTKFGFKDAHGNDVAVQTWLLAYWPDGSIKWTGFAATAGGDLGSTLEVLPGGKPVRRNRPSLLSRRLTPLRSPTARRYQRHWAKGTNLVEAISLNNQVVGGTASLWEKSGAVGIGCKADAECGGF